ncbi:glycosyltransferase [Heliobacterium chlorum]|uniref:Glycosyltransferase n=1 Tax=Heliobacterium chlorum TaxID=2698 RepID=A0ABR7T785_HELCL|nr:glycosyltransferase [Heliobacterium chlorum]MBC9785830.1 glycosyltransferase [Heliobacterium chlorum]
MRRKTIKYVGFYGLTHSESQRVASVAALNKMNYISTAMNKAGYDIQIISPSWMSDSTQINFEKQNKVKINDQTSVVFCPSWKTKSKITRSLKIVFSLLWLAFFLLINAKKNEKILAYHVPWLSIPIRIAKYFRKFELVLEVEEIYQDVMKQPPLFIDWENRLLDCGDYYIFSTDLLKARINNRKPYLTVNGVYSIEEQLNHPADDGKIHLLYSGIIDSNKKGAYNAIEASRHLPVKYHLHILGFGQSKEIDKLQKMIEEFNQENDCKISYDGLLTGEDYIRYAQACHIGLSTQTMEGNYLETSFPSKILSYLSLGLRVVSCYIEGVSTSKVGDLVTYYYQNAPTEIAKAICSIDIHTVNHSRERLIELDRQFIKSIKALLEE